jgi:4-hydroxy-tetrahydrodipicolinate synthase
MPALITPFSGDGSIDNDAFCANVDRVLGANATGVLIGGCTGEFWSLTLAERCELFRVGADAVGKRGTVLAGTGAVTVAETVALTRAAEDAGCDAALILPPYFIHLNEDEIFEHFRAVDAAVSLPIVLYNIPGNAINAITPQLASRLAELDHVVAIKESSGDWNNFYATLNAVGDRLRVFCGPSSIYGVPAMAAGADGFIDCFPNVWLTGGIDMYYAAIEGRSEEARALQRTGRSLTDLFTSGGRSLYPATKAAMTMLGYAAGEPRPPLQPVKGKALQELRAGLQALEIIN